MKPEEIIEAADGIKDPVLLCDPYAYRDAYRWDFQDSGFLFRDSTVAREDGGADRRTDLLIPDSSGAYRLTLQVLRLAAMERNTWRVIEREGPEVQWALRRHPDPYCATHCLPGSKHSQCGCPCDHRKPEADS
jgi:hypothetical protein